MPAILATMNHAELIALSRENAEGYEARAVEHEGRGEAEQAAKLREWARLSREEADLQAGVLAAHGAAKVMTTAQALAGIVPENDGTGAIYHFIVGREVRNAIISALGDHRITDYSAAFRGSKEHAERRIVLAAGAASEGWRWFAGENDEYYYSGPHNTRAEAEADAAVRWPGRPFHLIEAQQAPIDLAGAINIDDMLDRLHAQLGDEFGGEDGDSPAEGAWTDEQQDDLEAMVKAAARAWTEKHAIVVTPRSFTDTRNAEWIKPDSAPVPAMAAE